MTETGRTGFESSGSCNDLRADLNKSLVEFFMDCELPETEQLGRDSAVDYEYEITLLGSRRLNLRKLLFEMGNEIRRLSD